MDPGKNNIKCVLVPTGARCIRKKKEKKTIVLYIYFFFFFFSDAPSPCAGTCIYHDQGTSCLPLIKLF
jgi:hypothetical protein